MNGPQSPQSSQDVGGPLESDPLESDLDLCAEAARRIMGWRVIAIPWASEQTIPLWHNADGDPVMSEFSWRPDRDEAQNMQILDRMLELGYDFDLSAKRDQALARFLVDGNRQGQSLRPDRKIAVLEAAILAIRSRSEADV